MQCMYRVGDSHIYEKLKVFEKECWDDSNLVMEGNLEIFTKR